MNPFRQLISSLSLLVLLFSSASANIIITEIMYNPAGSENANEYIEIYNAGPERIPLNGYTISDGTGTDDLVAYNDPDRTIWIDSHQYYLILDRDYYEQEDPIYAESVTSFYWTLTTNDAAIGSGGLSNTESETITLRNPSGIIESERTYQIGAENGHSEEMIDLNGGNVDENWGFSLEGGSPLQNNTIRIFDYDLAVTRFTFEPTTEPGLIRPVTVTATVKNVGLQTMTSTLRVDWNQYRDPWHTTRFDFDNFGLGVLEPGDSVTFSSSFETPTGGNFVAFARLSNGEQNDSNNEASLDSSFSYYPGAVRISEIMARPPDTYPSEWVEIANFDTLGNDSVARNLYLAGWSLRDNQGIQLEIDPEADGSYRLDYGEPGLDRYLIAQNESILEWPGVEGYDTYIGDVWPSLNNDGDSLFLLDPFGTIIDRVAYPAATEGKSQVRLDFTQDAGIELWSDSPEAEGGTPGRTEDVDLTGFDFSVTAIDTISTFGQNGYNAHTYSVVVTIANNRPVEPPETIDVRLTWIRPGLGAEYVETVTHEMTPPGPNSEVYEIFNNIWYQSGALEIRAEILGNDDDPSNDQMDATFDFSYSYREMVISEVMALPGPTGGEWIEIGNTTLPIQINRWHLEDAAGNKTWPHSLRATTAQGGYLILAEDSASFVEVWTEVDPARVIPCSTWARVNDEGDVLRFYGPQDELVHQVTLPASQTTGKSLFYDINSGGWIESRDPSGATPGSSEYYSSDTDTTIGESYSVLASPNPFSPDGDENEDYVVFRVDFPANTAKVTVHLFDIRGRELGTIFEETLHHGNQFVWDGKKGLRHPLPVGMYVWAAEISSNTGSGIVKGTLVCAGSK